MDNVSNNDEILWADAAAGNADAEEQLIEKYSRLVRACSRPYFLVGGDNEDLIQEGMLGLLSAIRQYDPDRDASFRTYAELCIRNRLLTAIRSAQRFKHTPLNASLSIESPQFDESRVITPETFRDPEELIIIRELTDEIILGSSASLSRFEKTVLDYYLEGLSYAEISKKTGKPTKSVDNAIQRIRKKLAKFL